jgi:thiamine-phosphate pyrophosphorylase
MPAALKEPCLCLVADISVVSPEDMIPRASAAVSGGVDMVQLRAKELPGRQLLYLAMKLKEAIGDEAILMVNERVDVASASRADGVQLGEEALPISAAREILPDNTLVGRSVHTVAGAEDAQAEGADFLVVGTMFATDSHLGSQPAGPFLIRKMKPQSRITLIGIGGITKANLAEVVESGASGVAVIRSILATPDPQKAAGDLKQILLESWQSSQRADESAAARQP